MKLSWVPTILLLSINILSFLLFLKGFFPSKKILSGFNSVPILDSTTPKFDKIVFMVVDALRSDFLFSNDSKFTFVHQLINDNRAIPFTAYSNPPTVTLPRLKGITLGTTPNFLDAILNIADDKDDSQGLLNQDNWLYQFKYANVDQPKMMNFYGDDTWLKLFPEFFNHTDGTNSFFVNDFYDVDNNVTRHLDQELSDDAIWDGLFLHYLGLDHIGHKTGPNSKFMSLKQTEMDNIIQRIYNFISHSTKHRDTLFIVMGDHGMNEIGNHGGSSSGETNPGMVFISPKFESLNLKQDTAPLPFNGNYEYYKKISQIDLIPTLSLLFNLPIPKNNLGMIIKDFLKLFDDKIHHKILLDNCHQFYDLLKLNNPNTKKYDDLIKVLSNVDDDYNFLSEIQDDLIDSASNYNYSNIYQAIMVAGICFITILSYFNYYMYNNYADYKDIVAIQVGFIVYSIHFHGSSLIEEEHHLWWVALLIFMGYLFYKTYKSQTFINFIIILVSVRILKSWCNTGQKFNQYYTTSSLLLDNPYFLWGLIFLSYCLIGALIYFQGSTRHGFNLDINATNYDTGYFKNDFNNVFAFVIISILVTMSFTFKLLQAYLDGYIIPEYLMNFISWNLLAFNIEDFNDKKLVLGLLIQLSNYSSLGIFLLIGLRIIFKHIRGFYIGNLSDIINLLTLFLMNQTKIELIPLFMIFFIIKYHLNKIFIKVKTNQVDRSTVYLTVFNLLISNMSFFSMGGTNSLATVDLSNSYNGVGSYKIEIVSLLTFISNFIGPIYWSLGFLQILLESNINNFKIKESGNDLIYIKKMCFKILNLKAIINLSYFTICNLQLIISCFNLRFHLFVWTVFSPKLLYFGVWFVLVNVLIDLLVSSVLIAI